MGVPLFILSEYRYPPAPIFVGRASPALMAGIGATRYREWTRGPAAWELAFFARNV